MTHIVIRSRIMPGVRQWWDQHIGPDPHFKAEIDASTTPIVWQTPDGDLLTARPAESDWTPDSGREPTWNDVTHYFALPCRAVKLEY